MTDASAGQGIVPSWAQWRGPRFFAAPVDEPRARRATDVIRLVGSLVLLAVLGVVAEPPPGFERALAAFLRSWPGFLDGLWQLLFDLIVLWAAALVVAAAVRRRLPLARDLLLAGALAAATSAVAARWVGDEWPPLWDQLRAAAPPSQFPCLRLAIAGAVVITASPHLVRPARRLGHWLVALGALAVCILGAASPSGALAGLLVAMVASAAVHLLFGSSAGRPGLGAVAASLAELGVRTRSLTVAARQPDGYFLVDGVDDTGEPIVVKVYGRDAYDTKLLSTLWRTVWYREAGSPLTAGRLDQVNSEALITLLASQAGVMTSPIVTAGATAEDDALLVLRPFGQPLADLPADDADARLLARLWQSLARLHGAGITHGQLDGTRVVLDGDEIGFVDFRGGAMAAGPERARTDVAQALVSTALVAGEEEALRAAHAALGPDGLAAVLPYLQTPALTARQRSDVKGTGLDVDALRGRAAELLDADPPDLQKLRRVTWGTLGQTALLVVAFSMLLTGLTGLDIQELLDQLADATWWWVAIGALVAQLPRFTQALTTLGASPVPLPLGPVYALQLGVSYVNLAVPSSAARVAVNIRFFQRHGVPPGSAVAVGAIDGFAGFVVQAILLLTLLLLTPASLDLDLGGDTSGGPGRLVWLLVGLAVAAVVTVLVVSRWRHVVLGWLRTIATDAVHVVRGLRSPRRLGLLLGGSLATEVLFACALGAFARALGYPIGLGELILINVSVGLLAGLVPVPGGIGVVEGALAFGLVSAGLPEEAAFATAIAYRLACFYVPPIWGFFAFRWLERNKHL